MGSCLTFKIYRELDAGWLDLGATELYRVFDRPTIIDLRQSNRAPVFITTLLHGNETSGWDAIREFLNNHSEVSMVLLVGNIHAAKSKQRHLDHEQDFNRVWRQEPWHTALNEVLHEVKPCYAVDIHNNSSPNPHYSVVTDLQPETLQLARLFSKQLIHTAHTLDIISYAISKYCPSITIETGMIDDPKSVSRTVEYLTQICCNYPLSPQEIGDLECYETLGTMHVIPPENPDLEKYPIFNADFIGRSFETVPAGSMVAECVEKSWEIVVKSANSVENQTSKYLDRSGNRVMLKQDTILSMFTPIPLLALQDCVCYLLNKSTLSAHG